MAAYPGHREYQARALGVRRDTLGKRLRRMGIDAVAPALFAHLRTPMPKTDGDRLREKLTRHAEMFDPARARLTLLPAGESVLSLILRHVHGGKNQVLQLLLRAAEGGNEDAQKLIYVFQHLSRHEQTRVTFDELASSCGVPARTVAAIVVTEGVDQQLDIARLVAAFARTDATEAMAKSAQRISGKHADIGERDRVRLLQSGGLVPIPRNAHLHVHTVPGQSPLPPHEAPAPVKRLPSAVSFSDDMDAIAQAHEGVRKRLLGGQPVVHEAELVKDE